MIRRRSRDRLSRRQHRPATNSRAPNTPFYTKAGSRFQQRDVQERGGSPARMPTCRRPRAVRPPSHAHVLAGGKSHPPAADQVPAGQARRFAAGHARRKIAQRIHQPGVDLLRQLETLGITRVARIVLVAERARLEVDEKASVDCPAAGEPRPSSQWLNSSVRRVIVPATPTPTSESSSARPTAGRR